MKLSIFTSIKAGRNSQEDVLTNTTKEDGVKQKFPCLVLYYRKIALGVGLMSPNTTMSALALKLHSVTISIKTF